MDAFIFWLGMFAWHGFAVGVACVCIEFTDGITLEWRYGSVVNACVFFGVLGGMISVAWIYAA